MFLFLQASQRISQNLGTLSSTGHKDTFGKLSAIAKRVCENGGFVQNNPVGYWEKLYNL